MIVDYSVNIKNSSCKCDGSLIIDTFSGVAPFRYFLNNKKQLGNIIENLCEGKYVVKVVDRENEQDGIKFWRFKSDNKIRNIIMFFIIIKVRNCKT